MTQRHNGRRHCRTARSPCTTPTHGTFHRGRWHLVIAGAILAGAVFGTYAPSLRAPFLLDDQIKIERNPDIRNLRGIPGSLVFRYDPQRRAYDRNDPSRPLTYLTFMLNYHFGGLNTFGWHLVNTMLHLCNTIIMLLILQHFLERAKMAHAMTAVFFGTTFFAVHPVNAAAVSYIFSRSDLLATCFVLLGIGFFLRGRSGSPWWYIAATCCHVLALSSKQSAVVFPALVAIIDVLHPERDPAKRHPLFPAWAHALQWTVLVGYLLFRWLYLGGLGDLEAVRTVTPAAYALSQPYALLRYVQMVLVPVGLCIDHQIDMPRTLFDTRVIAGVVLLTTGAGVAILLWRKRTYVRARLWLLALLWCVISLSPTSTFFPTTSAIVENRLYLPGFGIALAAALGAAALLSHSPNGHARISGNPILLRGILTVLLLAFGWALYRRNLLFKEPLKLWLDVLDQYPNHSRAHNTVATIYYEEMGKTEEAMRHFQAAVALNPGNAEAHNNIANIYYLNKKYPEAIESYHRAIAADPNFTGARKNLAVVYYVTGDLENAIQQLLLAREINPRDPETRFKLAHMYRKKGLIDLARSELESALLLDPHRKEYRSALDSLKDRD